MLRGDVVAVEINEARARELEAERRAGSAPTNVRVVRADATDLAARSSTASIARSSTRRARASACSPRRPDLRWRATPLPELQLALLRAAAERVKPGGTIVYSVCTINADENEARRRRVRASRSTRRSATSGRTSAIRRRPEFLLTLPHVHGTSGFFIARLSGLDSRARGWRDWVRTVEIEPSLYAADFSRLGEQIDTLLRAGRPRLPLRRRRRPLRSAGHDRADRAQVDLADDPRAATARSTAT